MSIPIHQENEICLGDYETIGTDITVTEYDVDPDSKAVPDISILIVEDNKEIINFIQKELNSDYHIYKAANGQEALDILLKENIQLVISDIMMPLMDGIELCRKMKTDLQHSHIPIILLTAKNTLTSKIEGLETGADAYIEKPSVLEHLLGTNNESSEQS